MCTQCILRLLGNTQPIALIFSQIIRHLTLMQCTGAICETVNLPGVWLQSRHWYVFFPCQRLVDAYIFWAISSLYSTFEEGSCICILQLKPKGFYAIVASVFMDAKLLPSGDSRVSLRLPHDWGDMPNAPPPRPIVCQAQLLPFSNALAQDSST